MGDVAKENEAPQVQTPTEAEKKGDVVKENDASQVQTPTEAEKKEDVSKQVEASIEQAPAEVEKKNDAAIELKPVAEQAPTEVEKKDNVEVVSPQEPAKPEDLAVTPAAEVEVKTENKVTSPEGAKEAGGNVSAEKLEWHKRELALLMKIKDLESVKQDASVSGLSNQLKEREEELELTRARVQNLETQLQAALGAPGGQDKRQLVDSVKQQHEELLNKARGMIFDKTKIVKNQELQIEALTTQVQSLKDINQITKDLLEIRNSEIKAMEDRYVALEARLKGEKEKFDLLIRRAQVNSTISDDVKKEYETQMAIFKELKGQYEQKVQALVAENNRLKASLQQGSTGKTT